MLEWISATAIGFSILALVWASITDLKTRMVNDKISILLIIVGAVLYLLAGIVLGDWNWLLIGIGVGLATFVAAYLLWRLGFWAGGDVKLFTALAFLNPINWSVYCLWNWIAPLSVSQIPIFPFSLFIFSVLALLPVGIGMGLHKLYQKPEHLKKIFPKPKQKIIGLGLFALFIIGSEQALLILNQSYLWLFGLIVVFGIAPKKIQLILGIGLTVVGVYLNGLLFAWNSIQLFVALLVVFIVLKLFFSLRKLFRTQKKISQLEEGDIPGVDIVKTEKGIIEVRTEKSLLEIIKNQKKQGLVHTPTQEHVVCSTKRAGGLEKEQILELQKLAQENKIPLELPLKESTAFVPAILLAYLFLTIIGNPLWIIL
ncbi:prepilin peptidase [Candidatus Micrarchaeota archaeon]|nr:prepilin peptidase [Candidatus Micrarchaeota archaeon]MBU1929884.1 prepilin peptidase [Candidatus Micrarchaeota archaeon]